eukprot:gene27270-36009_t
MPTPGRRPSL